MSLINMLAAHCASLPFFWGVDILYGAYLILNNCRERKIHERVLKQNQLKVGCINMRRR